MHKKLVVSNHNSDLEWLSMTYDYGFSPDNTIIYDRSDEEKDWSHLGESLRSSNVGENIYDIMRFIVEHYDNLPDVSIFIKGNLFQRPEEHGGENYYTTKERFIQALHTDKFFSIWVDKWIALGDHRHFRYAPEETLAEGRLVQPIQDCDFRYNTHHQNRYFTSTHELWNWCFVDPPKQNSIEFIPANNFAVPKENILQYSKDLYEKIQSILYEPDPPYDRTCAEAHLLERTFYFMWSNNLVERKD